MKYKSDIFKTIHESAVEKFHIGAISEARMREYNTMCLEPETSEDNNAHETENIEHRDCLTV